MGFLHTIDLKNMPIEDACPIVEILLGQLEEPITEEDLPKYLCPVLQYGNFEDDMRKQFSL